MNDSTDRVVLRYWDKTESQIGDTVRVDEDWQGVVTDLVDTPEKMKAWALDEYGFFVVETGGARFFLPERFLHEYPVDLVSRPVA